MLKNIFLLTSVIFNLVGLYLIINDKTILNLSSFAILLMALIVFVFEKNFSAKLVRSFLIIACFGFAVEVVGVKFALPFGEYFYGDNLGFKFLDVPIILALNWLFLFYISLNLASIFKITLLQRAFFTGLLMLFIDLTIEPISANLDFWYWAEGSAGLLNYFSWFLLSLTISLFFLSRHNLKPNYLAIWHYFIYLGFFISLNFIL